jgi:methyltransferase (TIGR00027 family)
MSKINEQPPDWQRDEFMGLNVAKYRAAHQILDNSKILEDPLALRIIGTEAESKLHFDLASFQTPELRAFRAGVMIRNRYAEDELARSIQMGVRQYVILGAGLDTFAYRNPFPCLRVFEVDHAVTQASKRSCLEKAAIPIPRSVTYVSVDFERPILSNALRESGFKGDELTFVSFIGVVRYLIRETVISVLTSIVSSMRAGSEVVFDFAPPPSQLERLREFTDEIIVNWRSKKNGFRPTYFDPAPLTRDLRRIGFADVQLFGPKEMNARYCKDRTDGLRIRNRMHLVKVRV